ncbi:tetratricopeptide repeat protein [Aureispira anguillae]|uniref:Tetratricopeptide repeat protein n=1 Tax=Aureispira anguillae TaxID=2864201 RepID=A0A915YF01_9BACT|nr:tetratricopeptide repeat protein [Aureispira anguillae]BDS11778.1 tetratricopeptide repeat protein [Aureispira anguillae]
MASSKKNKKNKKSARPIEQAAPSPSQETKQQKNTKSDLNKLLPAAIFLLLITIFVYKGALDNDFVDWDDFTYVIENNLVRSDSDIMAFTNLQGKPQSVGTTVAPYNTDLGDVFHRAVSLNYHPLTILTMRWNNNACPSCSQGISARPFILWNIILHLLNTLLVLLLIYRLSSKNLLASIFVATIFALHPMHVESVAWVSERKDVLYTFFFLLGLLSYWNYLKTRLPIWLVHTFVLFILSCLSKAMAVVFPLVMLLLYFWDQQKKNGVEAFTQTLKPASWIHSIPFFVASLFFGLMAASVQSGGDFGGLLEKGTSAVAINSFDTFSLLQRFQFACYGFIQYIIKFFLPTDLCTFYPYPDQQSYDDSLFFKVAPFIVFLFLAGAVWSLKFTKSIFLGLGFYFITIVLVLQFVSVGAVIMADRYTYLPYIGIALMLALLVDEFVPKNGQNATYIGLIAFALLLCTQTIPQIETWQDSETLWTRVIDLHKVGDNVLQQNMEQPLSIRGNYYGKRSEKAKTPQEQQTYINKAFDDFVLAAKLGSRRPDVYEGMGNTYGMRGNTKQEQAKALKKQNKHQEAEQLMRLALKDFDDAINNYTKALEIKPTKGSTYFNRGVTYSLLRKHNNAIDDYTKVLQYAPEQAMMAHLNRGISYVEIQRRQEAIADFQQVLKYNPNEALAKRYLKMLLGK